MAVLTGAGQIVADYLGWPVAVYMLKPLTMVLIISIAARAAMRRPGGFAVAVTAGLTISLVGDVFLMLPGDHFIAGLVSFLIAHLVYIAAFSAGLPLLPRARHLLPFAVYGAVIFALIAPGLGGMAVPVAAYLMVILVMGWRAVARWVVVNGLSGRLAAMGALLFLASDTALAINRFRAPFDAADLVIMTTYYTGQWLIAISAAVTVASRTRPSEPKADNVISFKKRIRAWLIVTIGSAVFRMWFPTCRVRLVGEHVYRRYSEGRLPAVVATWHRGAIFLVWLFGRLKPMIMFSRSNDGELIARFAEKVGVIPVRGSSSRGGGQALRTMVKFLGGKGSRLAATVLDGPRGPRFEAKKGLLFLSRISGAPLVPVIVSAWPAVTLKKTWDRTLIPLPFSRVVVMIGEPIEIPPDTDSEKLEAFRVEVENTLKEMMRAADTDTGYIRAWPGIYDPVDTTPKGA